MNMLSDGGTDLHTKSNSIFVKEISLRRITVDNANNCIVTDDGDSYRRQSEGLQFANLFLIIAEEIAQFLVIFGFAGYTFGTYKLLHRLSASPNSFADDPMTIGPSSSYYLCGFDSFPTNIGHALLVFP